MKRAGSIVAAGIALALLVASTADATVSYSDLTGTSFSFINMTETTNTAGDPEPLWEAPSVSGDNLIFTPSSFISTANGGAVDQTSSTFGLTIVSNDKSTIGINQLIVNEIGDYLLSGSGGATTSASVLAGAGLIVTEVNVGGVLTPTAIAAFASDTFSVNTPQPGGGWSLSINADIQALVAAQFGAEAFATVVGVNWNNDLATASESTSTALIQKKIGVPSVTMTVVPEPGTALLFGLGLIGLATRRRA